MPSSAAILLLLQLICAAPTVIAQSASGNGWEQSFKAGMIDESTCKPIRSTEIVHLVTHKGRLYAGNGYWMDTRGYADIPWSQVLVLDSPEAAYSNMLPITDPATGRTVHITGVQGRVERGPKEMVR